MHNKELSQNLSLAALSLPLLMASLDTSIANVALPTLSQAFGAAFPAVQWVVLAYLVALTSLIVGAGRLGDLVGHRRLLMAGIALFTVASAACGLAGSLGALVAARALQGVGASIMMAMALSLVGVSGARPASGRTMGVLGSMSAVGTALGPSLGGALIALTGWRSVFLVNVPIGVASLLLVRMALPADRTRSGEQREPFDVAGTALLALALAAWSLAMTLEHAQAGARTLALLAVSGAALLLFVRVQHAAAAPLVRLELLLPSALGSSLALGAVVSAVIMTTLVVGPFYLSHALALGSAHVGLVLSVGPVVVALAGVPAGRAVDRLGTQRATLAGLVVMTLGALLLALIPAALGVPGYVLPMLLLTAGYALFQTANNTAVMAGLPAADRGVGSGLLSLSRNLGLVTGASAMGSVFALATRSTHVAAARASAVATGMHTTFALAATLLLLALLVATRRPAWAATAVPAAAHLTSHEPAAHSNPGDLS